MESLSPNPGTGAVGGLRYRDDEIELSASGEFDLVNQLYLTVEIIAAIEEAIRTGRRRVDLDVTGVRFMDASTIRTLVVCWHHAAGHGCELRVRNAAGVTARIFALTGVAAILCDEPSDRAQATRPASGERVRSRPRERVGHRSVIVALSSLLMAEAAAIRAAARNASDSFRSRRRPAP